MNDYQIYTLDSDGLTLSTKTFRTDTDDAAKTFCERYLTNGGLAEIWRDDHRIDLVWVAHGPAASTTEPAAGTT